MSPVKWPRAGGAGIAFAVVAATAYASGPVWAQAAYREGVDWPVLLTWRFIVAATVGWGVVLLATRLRDELTSLPLVTLAELLGLGILFVVNAATFYAALARLPVALAVVVSHLSPVLIFMLSRRYGVGLYGRTAVIALALATAGALLSVGGVSGGADALGVLLALVSTLVYAVWAMLAARKGGERRGGRVAGISVLPATTIMFTGTAIGFVGMAALSDQVEALARVPPNTWPIIAGLALFATLVGLLAWYEAARRIGVARTSIFTTVEPFVAMAFAFVFLGESVVAVQLLGAVLVVSAAVVLRQSYSAEHA